MGLRLHRKLAVLSLGKVGSSHGKGHCTDSSISVHNANIREEWSNYRYYILTDAIKILNLENNDSHH